MITMDFNCDSEQATQELGNRLGSAISEPIVIFLSGTLGAGKTRLVQALAGGLGVDPESVNSPTFTIMIPHQGRMTLLHLDAYRIKDLDEADQLGIDDWVESGCVLVVEWAERIAEVLPSPDLVVSIEHVGETERLFRFEALSDKGQLVLGKSKNGTK